MGLTNDIEKVSNNISCFGALLTPQGKYLFDFIIIKHKNGYFLDCEKNNIETIQEFFTTDVAKKIKNTKSEYMRIF